MGKRIIPRARGKGGPRYRVPSHKYKGKPEYNLSKDNTHGTVKKIIHDPIRNTPLILVKFPDGSERYHIAPEGIKINDKIEYWSGSKQKSIVPLENLQEGVRIFGIETYPGSGPKLCRSSGSFGIVASVTKDKVRIRLSSGKTKEFNKKCLATIGRPAGSGRKEKPWVKAGIRHYAKKVRGKLYPRVSGTAMNPVDHPFGGKTKPGISKAVSRHAPPGRKVGSISPRRMGKRKK